MFAARPLNFKLACRCFVRAPTGGRRDYTSTLPAIAATVPQMGGSSPQQRTAQEVRPMSAPPPMSPDEQTVYKNMIDSLSFMKRQQWTITSYAVAIFVGLFGITHDRHLDADATQAL